MSARRNGKFPKAIAAAITGVAIFIFSFSGAAAYSIYSTTTRNAGATASSSLLAPFENFVRSIGSIGASDTVGVGSTNNIHTNQPSIPRNISLFTDARNAFRQFDDWTYRTTGLRVSELFVGLLHIFSWFFGVLKTGADWLLQWVH